ncbi:hypothetical protein PCAR4_1140002 [Paraburkholderia caribensis]|nr:hypothetical protein PCAR4_1140002 [Paraburkholderia caribensis]
MMWPAREDCNRHVNTGVASDISTVPAGLRSKQDSRTKAAAAMDSLLSLVTLMLGIFLRPISRYRWSKNKVLAPAFVQPQRSARPFFKSPHTVEQNATV